MKDFESRINLNIPLNELSLKVCQQYGLGEFINNTPIKIGYEDYNYILTTSSGLYVVKVFSHERTNKDALLLAERACVAYESNISCPKIYKTNNNPLFTTVLNDVEYRLLVMEYINGKDFFSLKESQNEQELEIIATELAKLNNINYKPDFIYDKWAIVNFPQEYEKNISLVNKEDKLLINKALNMFKSCDLNKLKYGFVHGDIIETNIIKDLNGKLFFIDFSVSNYLPRIVDLAVTICDLCLNPNNIKQSELKTKIFIKAYEKVSPLSTYEKECLKKFIVCHQAITVLETIREQKIEQNNSEENTAFLQKGKQGLSLVLNTDIINKLII